MVDPRVLEPVAARAWRAANESAVGGWRLYASDGYSGRINACWPIEAPDCRLDEALDHTEAWYAARGLKSIFKVVEAAAEPPGLIEALAARGYQPHTETLMMVGPLLGEPDPEVLIADGADAAFEDVFIAAGTGGPLDARERLDALARIVPPRGFARMEIAGAPAAIGACAVEGRWVGVFGMRTAPDHRRKGLARRLFGALTAFGRGAGAEQGYLQVEADNAPAIALYAAAGFEEAYRYRYWSR